MYRLPQRSKSTLWILIGSFVGVSGVGTAALLLDSGTQKPGVFGFFVAMWVFYMLGLVAGAYSWVRTRRIQAVLTPDGIGGAVDGETTWLLPWSRFGGYQVRKLTLWQGLIHPERSGTEILDREGVVAGLIPIQPGRFRSSGEVDSKHFVYRHIAFWHEMDSHVPVGGPRYVRPVPKPYSTTWQRVAFHSATAAALLLVFMKGFVDLIGWVRADALPTDPRHFWFSFPGFLALLASSTYGVVGAVMATRGIIHFVNPGLDLTPPPRDPEEAGAYAKFRAERLDSLPTLQDNMRYRIGQPEFLRRRFATTAKEYGYLAPGMAVLLLFAASVVVLNPAPQAQAANAASGPFLALFFGIISVCFVGGMLTARQWSLMRLASLDDTVVPHEGGLVIVKPDGSHIIFSSRARKRMLGNDQLWTENGKRYILDLTHLEDAGPVEVEGIDEVQARP